MSRVSLSGNPLGSGTFTLTSPNSNTDRTLSLPDQTGTLLTGSGALNINASAPTSSLTLDASGNLGIGTTSPVGRVESRTANMTSGSSAYAQKAFVANIPYSTSNITSSLLGGFDGGSIHGVDVGYAYNGTGYYLAFATNSTTSGSPTERARIDSSGNLLVGTTSANPHSSGTYGSQLSVGGALIGVNNSHAIIAARWNGNGEVIRLQRDNTDVGSIDVTTTATSYNTSSDYRLKNTIAPMTGALAKVALLKPCTYKWNVDGSDGEGFIAHELAEVVPQCVTGEKDAVDADGNPKYQGIDTSFLVATLTAAIQELKADLDATKAELAALKGQQ